MESRKAEKVLCLDNDPEKALKRNILDSTLHHYVMSNCHFHTATAKNFSI